MAKTELKEGSRAPAFRLTSSEDRVISLSEFKGKKAVVLFFYPKDNTPGCTIEACDFRDGYSKFKARKTVVLGISFADLKSHQRFIDKHGLPFPLLYDKDKKIANAYGVYKKKKLYGREYMGIERSTFLIDKSGKIAKAYRKVKVEGHADQVLKDLSSL